MRLSVLLSLLLPSALAGTGGPDASGEVYTDDGTADGPTYGWLDSSGGTSLSLADDEVVAVELPFDFHFYGSPYSAVGVSSNGALFFAGPDASGVGVCPGTAGYTGVGVAAFWDDLGPGTVTYATFGTWPYRTFVVTWEAVPHATYGGAATFQVWLLEGRDEVVIQTQDVTFGDVAVDGGAQAVVGTFNGEIGLPWSCSTPFSAGGAIWFGDDEARPARAEIYTDELETPWSGPADFAYSGTSLLAADLDDNGEDDLVVGSSADGAGYVSVVYRPSAGAGTLDLADSVFSGNTSGDLFGAAVGAGDLDGDGLVDLAIGAPGVDVGGTDVGLVYLYTGGAFGSALVATDAAGALRGNTTGRPGLGASLALGDFNGDGYADLAAGAPTSDDIGTDSGSVYLLDGGATLGGTYTSADLSSRLTGGASGDKLGTAMAVADLDEDGLDDLALGAPYQDSGATNGGAVYLVYGVDLPAGSAGIAATANCRTTLSQASALLGSAVALGDVGGSTGIDVLLGAPYYDSGSSDLGAAFVFNDVGATCVTAATSADSLYVGQTASGRFATSLAAADVNGDGNDDLVAGAVNDNTYVSGGGVAYAFTEAASLAVTSAADADHAILGTWSGGRAGSGLAVAEGAAGRSLFVTAPYANEGATSNGAVVEWPWHDDFEDDDADGFVNADAGGNDCDDADATAFPGGTDTYGDSVDGDCDGWIDGELRVRTRADAWEWDVDSIGGTAGTSLDFENGTPGDPLTSLGGVTFTSSSYDDQTSRAWPVGLVGVTVSGGVLTMEFDAPVDALAVRWLDPDDSFVLTAQDADGASVVAGYDADLEAPSRAGGVYRGYLFAAPVSTVSFTAAAGDTFGLDELELVAAADTDRDLDGETETDGDCDDTDASVASTATEVLGNGVDDDCDGVVDGGNLTVWSDSTAWAAAASITPELIDFEDLTAGDSVAAQYVSLGATFDGTPLVSALVGSTAPIDTLGADAAADSLVLTFTEVQPAVAFTALDLDDDLTVQGYVAGTLVYSASWPAGGGAEFIGLTAEYGFDELVLTATLPGDEWGLDDVTFSALGLDDADGDGLTEQEGDCDDAAAGTYTGAEETWYDGVDGDCAGDDDYDQDADGVDLTSDCDDTDPSAYPGATETWYDGVDSDCSGGSDYDEDGDGHETTAAGGDDCDDGDSAVSPDATETWYDGVDSDCAGDDDYDADHDGYRSVGGSGGGDCDDSTATTNPGAAESYYDGVDNDCDPTTVDDDQDDDGYIGEAAGGDDCEDGNALAYPGALGEACYDGVDQDCDGADDYDCDADGYAADDYGGDDCDDADAVVHPGASDPLGDGVDSACDGGLEYDLDGDGAEDLSHGGDDCDDADATTYVGAPDACYDGADHDCDGVSDLDCDADGYDDLLHGGTDCVDGDATINPGALDFPYDGVDNDCGGESEYDLDGDGHLAAWYGGDDCDDADATVAPGAIDACYDGVDSDCGEDDDYDCDADSFVSADFGGDDCDDADAAVSPAAAEVAGDGIDQDCDGADLAACTDCDGDGVLAIADGGTDCDDTDASVFPGASDLPYDGVDSDCVGDADYDADGDGDAVEAGGGGDCDDGDAGVSSLKTTDDCGGGDEDCDGKLDEDCIDQDTGDTGGDTGPIDTGDTGDTGAVDPGDSADDDWRPEPEDVTGPRELPRGTVCGCDTTPAGSAGAVGLLMVAGVLARRRR